MQNIPPLPPQKTISVPFKVKQFDYNRYYIKYKNIKGILNLTDIVIDVVKPPPESNLSDPLNEIVGIRLVSALSFTNQGHKVSSSAQSQSKNVSTNDVTDITSYILEEEKQEHWNEYVLAESPSKILKTKTTLLKLLLVKDQDDGAGNPVFNATHNTVHAVFPHPASEAGSR